MHISFLYFREICYRYCIYHLNGFLELSCKCFVINEKKQPDNNDNGKHCSTCVNDCSFKSIFIVAGFAFPDENWTCLSILSYVSSCLLASIAYTPMMFQPFLMPCTVYSCMNCGGKVSKVPSMYQ